MAPALGAAPPDVATMSASIHQAVRLKRRLSNFSFSRTPFLGQFAPSTLLSSGAQLADVSGRIQAAYRTTSRGRSQPWQAENFSERRPRRPFEQSDYETSTSGSTREAEEVFENKRSSRGPPPRGSDRPEGAYPRSRDAASWKGEPRGVPWGRERAPKLDRRPLSSGVPLPQAMKGLKLKVEEERSPKKTQPEPAVDPATVKTSGPLLGRSLAELEALAVALGEPAYRGRQMHDAVYKNKVEEMQDISILSKALRMTMLEKGLSLGRAPVHHVAQSTDGTAKLLLKLEDDRLVETVGIPSLDGERLTACISSQVGCPLRCSFCATGKGGFARNLQKHEIVGQVLAIESHFKRRVSNIVLMGMGEPMLNLANVVPAVLCINKEIGIGQRMITISTVGVPNAIAKLADHQLQCTLAVSLHAPNQTKREQIIPSAKAYPLQALLKDCSDYFTNTGRRVTFEYTLLSGVNDSAEDAAELADLLFRKKLAGHVNLIPYNPVEGSEFERPSNNRVMTFAKVLNAKKITTSIRQTRGLDANAACGQLRNAFQKTPLPA